MPADRESVIANIAQRDLDDTTRAADPLRKADDAIVIDNSDITGEEKFRRALEAVADVLARVGHE